MSDPISPTTAHRLRLHASPNAASSAVRNSIISSSAKGWSPLQINKRDSISSPIKSPTPNSPSSGLALASDHSSPRRTSSSFKHVSRNSLVSNSPFKSPTTIQGQQAAGIDVDALAKDNVIHEKRGNTPTRSLGQAAAPATGVAATPKASIGLGITASKPRIPSGSAVSGTRKVSNERGKVAFPTATTFSAERKVSAGSPRKISGSKENESPDVRSMKRTPRQSMGLKGLAKGGYVSRSPFLAEGMSGSRSSSGGGLAAMASSRSVESPDRHNPSPKTVSIPIEQDDIFSSPSPRRVSAGKRRVSPGSTLARSSGSPSGSPTRFGSPGNLSNQARSPMGPASSLVPNPPQPHFPEMALDDTPTPTPHKSAITPSRRLRGPRGLAEYSLDSPSRQSKTVTFQSIPDVKEFEKMSNEGSADGSFEMQSSDLSDEDQEWIDDGHREDSMELDSVDLSPTSHITTRHVAQRAYAINIPGEISPIGSDEYQTAHESATADFMSALVEEGLFSPPELPTPSFEDQPEFDLPPVPIGNDDIEGQGNGEAFKGFLQTPSLGGSLHGTPMMAAFGVLEERDEAGIPYGRSHHSERNSLAHALPQVNTAAPLPHQPQLPQSRDHQMLLNIDASQPSIPNQRTDTRPNLDSQSGPHAHQSGTLPDPFITLSTTTHLLNPSSEKREEGGIPLGRTSHKDRTMAARMLATQSLGLGLPRSPAVLKETAPVGTGSGAEFDLSFDGADADDSFSRSVLAKPAKTIMAVASGTDTGTETGKETDREERMRVERKGSIFDSPGREMVFDASFELNDGSSIFTQRAQQQPKPLAYGPSASMSSPIPSFISAPNSNTTSGTTGTERKVSEVPEMIGPSRRMTQFKSKSKKSGSGDHQSGSEQEHEDGLMSPSKRGLPKPPPRVEQLDLPSPVTSPVKGDGEEKKEEKTNEKRTSKLALLPASLPFIGAISPFFSSTGAFPEAPEVPVTPMSEKATETARPLTPPPRLPLTQPKNDSPHRIPDFEFEQLSLHVVEPLTTETTSTTTVSKKTLTSPMRDSFQSHTTTSTNSNRFSAISDTTSHRLSALSGFSESTSTTNRLSALSGISGISEAVSLKSASTAVSSSSATARATAITGGGAEFGGGSNPPSSTSGQVSTTGKVRQRISREMIKETIQQRIADGSISRKPVSFDSGWDIIDIQPSQSKISPPPVSSKSLDKDLPPRPPFSTGSIPMTKANTTDATSSKATQDHAGIDDDDTRPKMRPRSQTQSAHEVAKLNAKLGSLGNPQSALDKLMGTSAHPSSSDMANGAITENVRVVSKAIPTGTGGNNNSNSSQPLYVPQGILNRPKENKDTGTSGRAVSGRVELVIPSVPGTSGGSAGRAAGVSTSVERKDGGKDGLKAREEAIQAKSREKEGREISSASASSSSSASGNGNGKGVGRRRSLSVGNALDEVDVRDRATSPRLTLGIDDDARSMLDVFREELGNIGTDRRYKVRERQVMTAGDDKVQHGKGGDIDSGRAWRQLRRPSDMNEYAAEIRAMKAKEVGTGKATGTIFVKVLGIENLAVPIPDVQTFFCITLDNGIDYIRTPYSVLGEGAKVNQEFSLVEHPNFEFSLSLDIRRDPHILKAIHEKLNPPKAAAVPSPAKSSGLRNIFSSPRKPKASSAPAGRSTTPLPILRKDAAQQQQQSTSSNTIAKYFATPGSSTIAKTHVAFKPIAKNCEAKVLEIRYPMFAMFKGEPDRHSASGAATAAAAVAAGQVRQQVAKITLQIFRLPPIPGLSPDELPASIDDCLRGMRHHAWWEHEYHEGILTQEGGDCTHPKRRIFKVIGGTLIAINEVTKKKVTSISLRQATGLEDLNATFGSPTSRATALTTSKRRGSDEAFSARPRSFRLDFGDDESIVFSADRDSDKEAWMTTLEGLIGKIPSNPLWAELLATKQREREQQQQQSSKTRSASSHSISKDGKQRSASSGAHHRRKASTQVGASGSSSGSHSHSHSTATATATTTATATPAQAAKK